MSDILKMKNVFLFAGGVLFGTAGIKALSGRDAKKVYTNCTAAVLRAKDCILDTVTTVQENAEDILAEAKQINEERADEEASCIVNDEHRKDAGSAESVVKAAEAAMNYKEEAE
ncbi:DUF6110 family protein [Schaedlerella sp.]|jgi:hypothetical protein|uniref:DUF6110 family protein n=1 Tax=Schaedlerella sp. TaxID=2676057 RepID=UPI0037477BAC|nr:hypothetical protein [Ruminococcus sp.]MCI9330009.1 hypothetical protein [Ruminococcus sp.]